MFSLTTAYRYYLYGTATDMRNSFDGLCGIVRNELHRDPLSGDVFLFINKRRNLIKLLRWEPGGFILYYKRLESGTFELPAMEKYTTDCSISWPMLIMILEGVSIGRFRMRKRYLARVSC